MISRLLFQLFAMSTRTRHHGPLLERALRQPSPQGVHGGHQLLFQQDPGPRIVRFERDRPIFTNSSPFRRRLVRHSKTIFDRRYTRAICCIAVTLV